MFDQSTINAIADLARRSQETRITKLEEGQPELAFKPGEPTPISLERFLARPARKRAGLTVHEPQSFIDYVNTHKELGTALFAVADEKSAIVNAVIDYHEGIGGAAKWGQHTVQLLLAATPEWARWLAKSKESMAQTEFAEFLEDNAADIVVPEEIDPSAPNALQMKEVALSLQAKTNVAFASSVRLDNGQHQLTYSEQIESKVGQEGKIAVPDRFYLSLAPFVGTDRYLIKARLRFRLGRGAVVFFYEIERPHKIVEAAFRDVRSKIESETQTRVLLGALKSQG